MLIKLVYWKVKKKINKIIISHLNLFQTLEMGKKFSNF